MSVYRAGRKIRHRILAASAGIYGSAIPRHAPDVRFARAAAEAEEDLDLLVGRAVQSRPRPAVAGYLLRRSRALAGLRELPKFVWLYPLGEIRDSFCRREKS